MMQLWFICVCVCTCTCECTVYVYVCMYVCGMNESGTLFLLFPPSSSSSVVTFVQKETLQTVSYSHILLTLCVCVCMCVWLTGKYLVGQREGLNRVRGIIAVRPQARRADWPWTLITELKDQNFRATEEHNQQNQTKWGSDPEPEPTAPEPKRRTEPDLQWLCGPEQEEQGLLRIRTNRTGKEKSKEPEVWTCRH